MKCPHCNFKMEIQRTSVNSSYGNFSILIHDVPSEVCSCGEQAFDFDIISLLSKIAEKYSEQKRPPREVNLEDELRGGKNK